MASDFTDIEPDSIRYRKHKKARSRRGRSLKLAQILIHLSRQADFTEFSEHLDAAARRVRKIGQMDAKSRKQAVISALESFATEIGEICEETNLSEADAIKTLESLIKDKTVTVRFRNNYLVYGEPPVSLYFLTSAIESIPDDLDLFPKSERRTARRKSHSKITA